MNNDPDIEKSQAQQVHDELLSEIIDTNLKGKKLKKKYKKVYGYDCGSRKTYFVRGIIVGSILMNVIVAFMQIFGVISIKQLF